MAARKTAVEAPAPNHTQTDSGLGVADMGIPVMSIVSKTSKTFELGLAKFGDICIGLNSEDPDTEVVYTKGSEPVEFYVAAPVESWYAMKFGKGDGRWDIDGTPRELYNGEMSVSPMPPEAEKNYRYTLLVPAYSTMFPVHFYVRGTAARAMTGLVNKLRLHEAQGGAAHALAFTMGTTLKTGDTNSWYVPAVSLAEPKPESAQIAAELWSELAPVTQPQITAGESTDAPTF